MQLRSRLRPWIVGVLMLLSVLPLVSTLETSSASTLHDPISIDGNGGFIGANGVTGGSGAPSDPYVIEGWEINASSADGVSIRNTDAFFVVRDIHVHSGLLGNNRGIYLFNATNGRVEGSSLTENPTGIVLSDAADVTLEGNVLSYNDGGIDAGSSTNVTIVDNVLVNNGHGILLFSSSGVVFGNNVSDNGAGLRVLSSLDVAIEGNMISSNGGDGMFFSQSGNLSVTNNTVSDNGGIGVHIFYSTEVSLTANSFQRDGISIVGVAVEHYNSHEIPMDNLVNAKPVRYYKDCSGIDVDAVSSGQLLIANCTGVRADRLHISNTDLGILLAFVGMGAITNSKVTNSKAGIAVFYSTSVNIIGNHVSGNEAGIDVALSADSTVTGNTISSNNAGTRIFSSSGILVHHNSFEDNPQQSFDDGGTENSWDDGYPSGGNYWSDYVGTDSCSGPGQNICPDPDGIGDTPYPIDPDSQDEYPLMQQYTPPNTPPVAVFSANPAVGGLPTTFILDASSSWDLEDPNDLLEFQWDWEDDGVWDTGWSTQPTVTHRFTTPGLHTVRLEVRDSEGLANGTTRQVLVVEGPLTSLILGQPNYSGDATYIKSSTTLGFNAFDLSGTGILRTMYRVDNTTWVNYTAAGAFSLQSEGVRFLEWFSEDNARNAEAIASSVLIVDDTPPATEIKPVGGDLYTSTIFVLLASDAGSGVNASLYGVDEGEFAEYTTGFSLAVGSHEIAYYSVDNLGNEEESATLQVWIDSTPESPAEEFNWKPHLAVSFAIVLLVMGIWLSKRAAVARELPRRAAVRIFIVTSMPFVLAEVATGAVSTFTGLLSVPPIVGTGMAVDLLIVAVGVLGTFLGTRRMPRGV